MPISRTLPEDGHDAEWCTEGYSHVCRFIPGGILWTGSVWIGDQWVVYHMGPYQETKRVVTKYGNRLRRLDHAKGGVSA